MPSTKTAKKIERPLHKAGCAICGAVFRKHQTIYAEEAGRAGVLPGTMVTVPCPNKKNHERLLHTKGQLVAMQKHLLIEKDKNTGLDILCTELLGSKIQQARARLRQMWADTNDHVWSVYTGEFEEFIELEGKIDDRSGILS